MESAVIFGKNRHFFGGIAPSNMLKFEAKYDSKTSRITITAELPSDTIIDGQMVCCVGGAVIRKSYTDYPKDEFDGELVADITSNRSLSLTDDHSGTIYYAAFPYSKQGVYNRNKSDLNRSATNTSIIYTYLFGYDLNTLNSNPDGRVSYPSGVENFGFTSARMNHTNNVFEPGSWNLEAGQDFMPRPCMLTYNGTVEYFLDPNDYTKKEDGNASDVTDTSHAGNAMMQWPKIYTKRWEEDGVYHFRCSDAKIDNDWECWCNYDKNNNEIPYFYTAIYQGRSISNRLRSMSGLEPDYSVSLSAFSGYAKANSDDHDISVLSDRLLITDLLVMITGTTDLQNAIGIGARTYGTIKKSGVLDAKGMFWGTNITGNTTDPVKVFGMENWWGNREQFLLGWCSSDGRHGFKFTRGTKDGSTVSGYNYGASISGYKTGIITDFNTALGTGYVTGYIKKCMFTVFGRIPYAVDGSSSTYECDELRVGPSNRTSAVGLVSDVYYNGGPFQCDASLNGSSDSSIGASLSCKPSAS